MLKKTITYTDYEGNQRTEDFFFNLTKVEVTEKEVSVQGGYSKLLERVTVEKDPKEVVGIFKEFILESYGVKSPDGKRFIKSKELSEEFAQTEAFTELFMEFMMNPEAATAFVTGVLPAIPK